ncbi:MAG: hypothetical protein PHP41_02355 [Bacilli bacterium]|nr:hypothetical protein [Bacilli bacterium]MDY0063550.1 hypothetical protein [Bacilli bacterium]
MRILGTENLQNLLVKRDEKRRLVVHQQLDTAKRFEPMYYEAKKKAKNHFYYALYSVVAYLLFWLFIYDQLENLYIKILIGIFSFLLIVMIFRAVQEKQKEEFVKREWDRVNLADEEAMNEVIKLQRLIASEMINVICFSENYLQLQTIPISEQKQWYQKKLQDLVHAIQAKNNNKATVIDFIAFYETWQQKVESE